ncbi:hypothetical protein SAMN05421504_10464 [Amycolatopsis xylanica]|uniref:Secreted protein n=1 Tax=Amycolatopsis xylanica TaxID=589385 RepID=A0A1H3G1G0_9PSEU|nr:hypothetical protein [Amycolatopsis xylanica]SDX96498.1 hypothetical protein SAMN05421504_10464 [Amycolatopsis xylanica]
MRNSIKRAAAVVVFAAVAAAGPAVLATGQALAAPAGNCEFVTFNFSYTDGAGASQIWVYEDADGNKLYQGRYRGASVQWRVCL